MHHHDLDGEEADRIAVRRRGRDGTVTDDTVAAGTIDDRHRLAEIFFQERTDDARHRIGAAARTPRADQLDGT